MAFLGHLCLLVGQESKKQALFLLVNDTIADGIILLHTMVTTIAD